MTAGGVTSREHGHGSGAVGATYLQSQGEVCTLTAGADGRIKLWSAQGGLLKENDDNESDALYCLAVSPDGSFLAVGDDTKVMVRECLGPDDCSTALHRRGTHVAHTSAQADSGLPCTRIEHALH